MAEVTPSSVGKVDITTTTTMRQTNDNDNERETIFAHRSCQSKDTEEEEWKSTTSPTKRSMIHKRQELENRFLQMISAGGSSNIVDRDQEEEEEEVRQQIQEGIEDQHDGESRTHRQSHVDEDKTQQTTRRDSAAKDPLQQVLAPFCGAESPLNLKPQHCDEGQKPRQTITVSPNLLNLSNSDKNHQQNLMKPNRWRSLDMNLVEQSQLPPQGRRASMDRGESSRFGRQRQWQKDLHLNTETNVHCVVQDRIQIQELQKKVSSLLYDLHEAVERETDLEAKVSSLTNENDLLKEQVLQLQKQLNAKSSLSASSKTSNEGGTETSCTSAESSQDPLFPDSDDSLRKEKEGRRSSSSAALLEGESQEITETAVTQQASSEPEPANELAQAPDTTHVVVEEQAKKKPSEPEIVAEVMAPMTPQRAGGFKKDDEPERRQPVHEKQVDWTPPAKPSRQHAAAAPHYNNNHPGAHAPPRSNGFCIDTCDNSTLSYSLYKGMAEIYDGTVDTGMAGDEQAAGGCAAHNNKTREDDDEENWEFLTERVSL